MPDESDLLTYLELPATFRPFLTILSPHLVTIFSNSVSGQPLFRGVPRELAAPYHFFMWHCDCEGRLQDLHIIINDIQMLRLFPASPDGLRRRYFLLFRAFFNELFRSKEELSQILACLRKHGVLDRGSSQDLKAAFHEAFSHSLELRNRLVHSFVNPNRLEEELIAVAAGEQLGYMMVKQGEKERTTTTQVLKRVSTELAPILRNEAERLRVAFGFINGTLAEHIARAPAPN